jgi:ArsR family transcriptional regulator
LNPSVSQDEVFQAAAGVFAVLAEPLHLKVVHAVCCQDLDAGDIAVATGITLPQLQGRLDTLVGAGILAERRVGSRNCYSLRSMSMAALCSEIRDQVALDSAVARAAGEATLRTLLTRPST